MFYAILINMDKSEKQLQVLTILIDLGVSRENAIMAISEIWSEQDLDEILSYPPKKLLEIAQDMQDLL